MIFHSFLTNAGYRVMPPPDSLSRSPSPMAQEPTLSMTELSSRFRTYTLDGQPKQEQDYNFMMEQPILFTQPNYSQSATTAPPAMQSDPPSPTADSSPLLAPAPSPSNSSEYINSSSYLSTSASRIRQQRQRAIRMQCAESHLRDISALLARMVAEGDQCSVYDINTPSLSRTSSSDAESEVAQDTALHSQADSCVSSAPEMVLDDEDDDDDVCHSPVPRRNSSSDNTRASLSSSAASLRCGRLGSRCSLADLRAQPSVRDGISKNGLRSKRSTLTRRRPATVTAEER